MSDTESNEPGAQPPVAIEPPREPETGPPPGAPAAAPVHEPRSRRRVLPFFATVLFIALCAAVGYLWQQHQQLAQRVAALPEPANPDAQIAVMSKAIDTLRQQITALQSRPTGAPDLAPVESRLAVLEKKAQEAPSGGAAVDLGPLQQKLDSLAAEAAAARGAEADMKGRIADLTERLTAALQQARSAETDTNGKIADLTERLSAATEQARSAEAQARQLGSKANEAQRVEQAQVALNAGEPLGPIPDAPPALARFATERPPTEASLRLAFPKAAEAAIRASAPDTAGKTFGERMWLRARGLVTIKQGEKVVLGAPAAEVLGAAQARLNAGDLAGTVQALDDLDKPAAAAMAPWRQEAEALLAARMALAKMARG